MKALITIIQNGHYFFQLWYRYYTQFFDPNDIYVIDYCSSDGSLTDISCNQITKKNVFVSQIEPGNQWLNDLKTELLRTYDTVFFSDYDELLFYPTGLDQLLLDYPDARVFTTVGYDIVQDLRAEAQIDFSQPILEQRICWSRNKVYDKPLVTRTDCTWGFGHHFLLDETPTTRVPDLYLLHLKMVDFDLCYRLNMLNFEQNRPRSGGGQHNFLIGPEFENWWYSNANLELIPEEIKTSEYLKVLYTPKKFVF